MALTGGGRSARRVVFGSGDLDEGGPRKYQHTHRRVSRRRDRFKAHGGSGRHRIITDFALTRAGGMRRDAEGQDHAAGQESRPVTVLADSAYGSGDLRAALVDAGHVDRVKPAPTRSAVPGGFTVDDFTVDHAQRTATCPRDCVGASPTPVMRPSGRRAEAAGFGNAALPASPAKA